MELINKWDIVSKLIDLENEFQHYKPFAGFERAMYRKVCELEKAIGKTSGVDLVKCKDCKWWGELGCAIQIVDDSDKPKENDFCSFGERKDDAED